LVIKLGWYKATPEKLEERKKAADEKLLAKAMETNLITNEADAVIRDLKPSDLGITNEVWSESYTSANAWNEITGSNQQITDKIIVIYGVANLAANPLATGVKLYKGAGDKTVLAEIFFEPMYVRDEPIILFEEDYIYEDEDYISIFAYAKATGTDNLAILGRVIESRDKSPIS